MEDVKVDETTGVSDDKKAVLVPYLNDQCKDISKEGEDGMLFKEILQEGDTSPGMKASDGCEVTVHYIGRLVDGTVFDRSDTRGSPFTFVVGEGKVIKGWDQGIPTMYKGERSKLYIHPDLAYGAQAQNKIPANSPLIFEVTLIDFKAEDLTNSKSGNLLRRKIRNGKSKFLNPNDGASLTVSIEGEYEGRHFDQRKVSFVLGEGCEIDIPYGVEKALYKFSENEKSILTLGPKYAFGSKGSTNFNIPPNATVNYIVELESFERAREAWQMDPAEKLEASVKAKEKGTDYFKQEKYFLAARQYKNIVNFLKTEAMLEGEPEENRKALLLAAYLNQAICHLKINEPVIAKHHADDALDMDPNNTKGYYRRGLANIGIKEPEAARQDFFKVLELEPDNKAAKQQIAVCDKLIKQHKDIEKKKYSKMFEKFARLDTAKEQAELRKQPNGLDNLDEWHKGSAEKMEVEDAVTIISGP